MEQKVAEYIKENRLITDSRPVIVGLSGGADSVALLNLLIRLGYNCIAAHCNFHLRGEESYRDEKFALTVARQLNIPFHTISFDTHEYAAANRLSIEMAARNLRYAWFKELKEKEDAQAIAVAHHRDDNVETVLLNLTRGTGFKGLRGMLPQNENIIRPLLETSRRQILEWLTSEGIPYITDSSNASTEYTRNYIRLEVIPTFEKINPSFKEAVSRMAGHLAETEKILHYSLEKIRSEVFIDSNTISIDNLLAQPTPESILYELLQPYGFNRFIVRDVFNSLAGEPGKVFLSPTHRLVKDRSRLLLQPVHEERETFYTIPSGTAEWEGPVKLSFRKVVLTKEFLIQKDTGIAYFDYDKLSFPLICRTWKPGDWFIPFGMNGRKKLSDYFSDHKFSLPEKDGQWLLCNGNGDILWITGNRTDARYRIDEKTQNVMIVKICG